MLSKKYPLPGGIAGLPCFLGGNKYGNLAFQIWGVSNLRKLNLVMCHAQLGPERDFDVEAEQQL
jgi:hypothetical protein